MLQLLQNFQDYSGTKSSSEHNSTGVEGALSGQVQKGGAGAGMPAKFKASELEAIKNI